MADPVTLKRIEEMAVALNRCDLVTLEDLRMCLSRDVNSGIRWVTRNTGVSEALLMAFLIAEAGDDAGKKDTRKLLRYWRSLKTFPAIWSLSAIEIRELFREKKLRGLWEGRKPFWAGLRQPVIRLKRVWHNRRRYWLDVLAVVLVLGLSTGLVLRLNSVRKKNVEYVAVKQGASLPVFHKLTDDVEMKKASGSAGSFTSIDQVRDRYTLTAIPAGALLQASQLLDSDFSKKMMPGRKVLSVPLKAGAYSSTLSTPSEAIMVLSPRKPEAQSPTSQALNVILLSIEGSGDAKSATVVLPEDKFNIAYPLLASHDVFLVQPVR